MGENANVRQLPQRVISDGSFETILNRDVSLVRRARPLQFKLWVYNYLRKLVITMGLLRHEAQSAFPYVFVCALHRQPDTRRVLAKPRFPGVNRDPHLRSYFGG